MDSLSNGYIMALTLNTIAAQWQQFVVQVKAIFAPQKIESEPPQQTVFKSHSANLPPPWH